MKLIDRSIDNGLLSYPILWPVVIPLLVFWAYFIQLFSQRFYNLFHNISQFIFPAFNFYLYLSIYSFILQIFFLLVYSSDFIPSNLNFYANIFICLFSQFFHFLFPRFTRFKVKKSHRFRRNFGREVTLKYLMIPKGHFFIIYLLVIISFILFISYSYFTVLFLYIYFRFYLF